MENTGSVRRYGIGWKVVGVFAMAVSLFQGFMYDVDLSYVTSRLSGYTALDILEYLAETVIWGITFLGILLAVIVFGIGSIVKAINKQGQQPQK